MTEDVVKRECAARFVDECAADNIPFGRQLVQFRTGLIVMVVGEVERHDVKTFIRIGDARVPTNPVPFGGIDAEKPLLRKRGGGAKQKHDDGNDSLDFHRINHHCCWDCN